MKEGLGKTNKKEKYDKLVITEHLCRSLGVPDPSQLRPFGTQFIGGYETARVSVLPIEMETVMTIDMDNPNREAQKHTMKIPWTQNTLKRAAPPHPFTTPDGTVFAHDLTQVAIFNVQLTHYVFQLPDSFEHRDYEDAPQVAARLLITNRYWDEYNRQDDMDKMHEVMGGVKSAFIDMQHTSDHGNDVKMVPPVCEQASGYQNRHFIRTFFWMNETNIWNGVVKIPKEICIKARLVVWQDDLNDDAVAAMLGNMKIDPNSADAEERKKNMIAQAKQQLSEVELEGDAAKSEFYVALPVNHILSWGYHSESFRASKGHRVCEYRISHDKHNILLFYLTNDVLCHCNHESYKKEVMNKVDKRNLRDFGVDLVPIIPPKSKAHGKVEVRIKMSFIISFVSAPRLDQKSIDGLAPILPTEFLSSAHFSTDEFDKALAMQNYLEDLQNIK